MSHVLKGYYLLAYLPESMRRQLADNIPAGLSSAELMQYFIQQLESSYAAVANMDEYVNPLRMMNNDGVVVISYDPGLVRICLFTDRPDVATKYAFYGPNTIELTPIMAALNAPK